MLGDLFSGWHILVIVLLILLLFGGATRLPALARSLGQSRNAFKAEMKKGQETPIDGTDPNTTVESTSVPSAPGDSSSAPKP